MNNKRERERERERERSRRITVIYCLPKRLKKKDMKNDVSRMDKLPKSEVRTHESLANDIDGFEQSDHFFYF